VTKTRQSDSTDYSTLKKCIARTAFKATIAVKNQFFNYLFKGFFVREKIIALQAFIYKVCRAGEKGCCIIKPKKVHFFMQQFTQNQCRIRVVWFYFLTFNLQPRAW